MKQKSNGSLDRRDLLKLLPQTAAYLAIAHCSVPKVRAEEAAQHLSRGTVVSEHNEYWTPEWIWEPIESAFPNPGARVAISGSKSFHNLFTYFRKTFNVPGDVSSADARISGDSRYKLYVNGHYVGRGPARCSPEWKYYDEYQIAPFIRNGQNTIAVLLHFYGQSTGSYILSRPGLAFECELAAARGNIVSIKSDGSWKYLRSPAYAQDVPRVNEAVGFVEIYDARHEPNHWKDPEFDDHEWSNAAVIPRESSSTDMPRVIPPYPCENIIPRDIPMLLEREIIPVRVLQVGQVKNVSSSNPLSPAMQMSQESITPLTVYAIHNAESLIHEKGGEAIIKTASSGSSPENGVGVAIVFDFGREITGYPRIELDGVEGAIVDIGVSESLLDGRVTPTRNGLHCNRYITRSGQQVWEAFEWDGFRYLQLTIRNCSSPLTLRKLAVNFTSYPVGTRGIFESNDELLNRIWEVSRHTLQLCMHDAFEDCPNREQRQWVGDGYIESKVNYAVFGDTKLAAKFLHQISQSQFSDGITGMYYPGDREVIGSLNIKDFVLHWVSAVWEYYCFTDDTNLVKELYPNVARSLAWFEARLGPNGLLCNVTPWIFYDWAPLDKRGESTILNVLFYNCLREAAQMATIAKNYSDRARFTKLADRIKAAINDRLWDERRGVYVDARIGDTKSRRVSQQSNSVCILYDIASPEKRTRIIDYILSPKRVKRWQGPSMPAVITSPLYPVTRREQDFDEETDVVEAQPFFMHWLNAALAHIDKHDRMVEVIREKFGAMIDSGASTIWETWSPDASECHGWSTTAAYDLTRFILGVRNKAPGFAEFTVEPHPGKLQWARGRVPSARGDISVSWKSSPGRFQIEGNLPKSCRASLLIPLQKGDWPVEISMAGKLVSSIKEANGSRVSLASEHYAIEAKYPNSAPEISDKDTPRKPQGI